MSFGPTIVISDVHFGAIPAGNERSFLDFLDSLAERTRDVVIAGDLFDFWFEYRRVIPRRHFPVLRRLAGLRDEGVRIRFVGGNHDAWTGEFLRADLGIELLGGTTRTVVGGRRTLLAHGDGLAGGDWGYRALKAVTRSRIASGLFRLVHPDFSLPLVGRVSETPKRHDRGPDAETSRADRLSDHAADLLREDSELELVIFGHTHRPEIREVEPGRHYLNAGDWIHHRSYGVVSQTALELRAWRESGDVALESGPPRRAIRE